LSTRGELHATRQDAIREVRAITIRRCHLRGIEYEDEPEPPSPVPVPRVNARSGPTLGKGIQESSARTIEREVQIGQRHRQILAGFGDVDDQGNISCVRQSRNVAEQESVVDRGVVAPLETQQASEIGCGTARGAVVIDASRLGAALDLYKLGRSRANAERM